MRDAWIRAALLAGVAYFLVGRLFALPADHVHAWRLAAWIVCGAAYAAHIGYEHFRLRHPPRALAWHAAVGVAIGAFALAVAGMMHALQTGLATRTLWLLALVLWPAITAVPAFLVALAVAVVLGHRTRSVPGAGRRI